ncbi:MAG: MMPL family transporter, partial [Acidimicrobiia bacterium]
LPREVPRPPDPRGPMLRSLTDVCFRRRRLVVLAWGAIVIALTLASGAIGDAFEEGFGAGDGDSGRATQLLEARFPARAGDTGELVVKAPAGIDTPAVRATLDAVLANIERVEGIVGTLSPFEPEGVRLRSRDPSIAYAEIAFAERATKVPAATADAVRDLVADAGTEAVQLEVGGRMFNTMQSTGPAELVGLAAAIVILLLAFGSILAMGLPIAIALFGIGAGFALISLLSRVATVPDFTTQLAAMIGLGVGIDYALFIVTRFRQGLHDGMEPRDAVLLAIDTAGRSVLFAGATVVVSLGGLFLMGVPFIRGLGAGAAVTVLLMMIASVTLLPALLGFTGRSIDRFHIPAFHRHEGASRTSVWFRWSRTIQARPWPAFLAGFVVLVVLAMPMIGLRLGFSDAGNDPPAQTTRRAYDLLSEGFGPGFNGPLVLAVDAPDGLESLTRLTTALSDTPGVAEITPPVPNPTGDAAVIQVIPTSSPQSGRTNDLVDRLRDGVIPHAVQGTDTRVLIGGITASGIDTSDALASRLPVFIGAVLAFSFLLLMAVFRSIFVPVKAVIMNLLSIGAAYGVIVAIFQWGWGAGVLGLVGGAPIEPFVPMMLFAIVFGLSMDYEVFLLSRVREEYDRTGDNGLAVADGLAATARVITAAAAIMVTVFASFMLGEDRLLKLFGLGLALAILIDATLVRIVLVPATMELLGDRNWWFPRWLDRIVPRLHVEAVPKEAD